MDDNPAHLPLPRARASAVFEIDFGAGRLHQVRLFWLHFSAAPRRALPCQYNIGTAAQWFAMPVQRLRSCGASSYN